VNNSLLCQRLAMLAPLILLLGYSLQAASEPALVATLSAQAPIPKSARLLAWDRVGSPTQMRA